MFKKLNKLVIGLVMVVMAIVVTTTATTTAATYKGTAEGTQTVVTQRGDTTSVTYTFTTADGEINGLAGVFTWDETLLTLDGAPVANNMVMTDWGTTGTTREYHGQINYPGAVCEVTFNFKNVLPEGTATAATVGFAFTDVDLTHLGLGVYSEFYDSSWNPMLPSEIDFTEATIRFEEPVVPTPEINITVDPTTAKVEAGKTQKFTATVANDATNAGVTWAVSGATSEDTKIDANGMLTIGNDETAETLTVSATSVSDTTKSASAVVTVVKSNPSTDPTDPTDSVDPTKPTKPADTTDTGKKDTTVKASTSPNTGDTTNVAALSLLAVAMLGVVVATKKVRFSKK